MTGATRGACLLALLALGLAPVAAVAHPVGLSRSELVASGSSVHGQLRASARELGLDAPAPDAARASRDAVVVATLGQLRVLQDGAPCPFAPGAIRAEPPDGFVAEGAWSCPRPIGRLEIEVGFLATLPQGHTHLARVLVGGAVEQHVVRAGAPRFTVGHDEPVGSRAAAFVRLGVEHILTGFDHLAFLLAVLLGAPTLRRVAQLVTSFTVAHSFALALAASGAVSVSPRLVEPLIAASIVAVALENLWLLRRGATPEARARGESRRWLLTFAFGLVHGLGFAGALGDLHLAGAAFVLALVSFNVGVEVGQIAVAALVLPPLFALRRSTGAGARTAWVGSAAVMVAGLAWLVERVAAAG